MNLTTRPNEFTCSNIEKINQHLSMLIPEGDMPQKQLYQAARYALLSGGKRLRPLLMIATAEAFGTTSEKAMNAACSIEMVHAYSMVHDDLPCMDDDDFRRGKPTVHKAFTEAHAVLAGDFLLTYAFELIASDPHLSPQQQVALVSTLSRNSGGCGMIAGQMLDMEAEGIDVDAERLQLIHRYKTGALISAAVEMGGIIGGANATEIIHLRDFGGCIGLAFQIVDDILDQCASEEKHGRKTSSDVLNDKMTYVKLFGIQGASQKAAVQIANGHKALQLLGRKTKHLASMADQILERLPTPLPEF